MPRPRIMRAVTSAPGGARGVVNVGTGSGSYEPAGAAVAAVGPSAVMIAQRPAGAAPARRASVEHPPFSDGAFDAALAVPTVHRRSGRPAGPEGTRRVARGRDRASHPCCRGSLHILTAEPLTRALFSISTMALAVAPPAVRNLWTKNSPFRLTPT